MEIEIRDISDDPNNIVPIVYFIPKGFKGEPLMGNCRYAALSQITKIISYPDFIEVFSDMTPVVKKIVCEKLLILSDDPDSIILNGDGYVMLKQED